MVDEQIKIIEMQKELIDLLKKDMEKKDKMIRVLQTAVREAGNIFSDNPPGDLDKYDPDMINALYWNKSHPGAWERYFLQKAVNITGIKSLEDNV